MPTCCVPQICLSCILVQLPDKTILYHLKIFFNQITFSILVFIFFDTLYTLRTHMCIGSAIPSIDNSRFKHKSCNSSSENVLCKMSCIPDVNWIWLLLALFRQLLGNSSRASCPVVRSVIPFYLCDFRGVTYGYTAPFTARGVLTCDLQGTSNSLQRFIVPIRSFDVYLQFLQQKICFVLSRCLLPHARI